MLLMGILFLPLLSCRPMMNDVKEYPYAAVPGDSLHTRIYTLKNGLTVYMSPNKELKSYTITLSYRVKRSATIKFDMI